MAKSVNETLNSAVAIIAAHVQKSPSSKLELGPRQAMSVFFQECGLECNTPADAYKLVDRLNKAARWGGDGLSRLGTEALDVELRFMINDEREDGADAPVWYAAPLDRGLKLQAYESHLREFHRHSLNSRRAAEVVKLGEADEGLISDDLLRTAEVQRDRSKLQARASEKILEATAPSLLGNVEPLATIGTETNAHFQRLMRKLDRIETAEDPGFSA